MYRIVVLITLILSIGRCMADSSLVVPATVDDIPGMGHMVFSRELENILAR